MADSECEIEMLNLIAGVEDDAANEGRRMNPNFDFETKKLVEFVVAETAVALSRTGTDGAWCFGCGASGVSLDKCGCDFSETFGCAGRLFCTECRKSRAAVANHVHKLLSAKRVDRVSSIRLRLLRELRNAARAVEGEDSDAGDERLLSFWLSNADEFGDSSEAFRAGILRAFRRAKFLDFASLAKSLRQAQDESLIRAVIRSGLYR